MNTWNDDNPTEITPLRYMVLGFTSHILVLIIGIICGTLMEQDRVWRDVDESRELANDRIANLMVINRTFESWDWVRWCNPSPVSQTSLLLEDRMLVTVVCPVDLEIPD